VEVLHDPALNPTGAFTIEAWVLHSSGGRCETIISKGLMRAYWLGFCSGTIRFYASGSGSSENGNTAIPAEVWTHIAVVYEGSGRRYYINGELDYTGGPELAPTTNTLPVFIGADPGGGTLYEFQGNIAEVRLWNVVRTQDEIRRTMHVALEEPLPGLVANWHLSDDYQDNIGSHDGARATPAWPASTVHTTSVRWFWPAHWIGQATLADGGRRSGWIAAPAELRVSGER